MSAPSTTVARRDPGPGLLRTLASAVLLDGRGDVELLRETRGAAIDWGGVYAQHVRLTGPWRISIDVDGTSVAGNVVNVEPTPEKVTLGMKVRLTTVPIGTDSEGVEAVGFGYEPVG